MQAGANAFYSGKKDLLFSFVIKRYSILFQTLKNAKALQGFRNLNEVLN